MPLGSAPIASNTIGNYELLRHIATGGMAEIFLARKLGIERFEKLVVVKRLLPRIEQDPSLVSMFLDEARVAATLHHPNVVQVYDIGMADSNEYFFSMEFVYGQDLSHLLRRAATIRKRPTLDQALTIVLGLCSGLHYAHQKEGPDGRPLHLVHRDVSPQNVLISYDGAVKLMDFGIAKAATNSQVTRDGTLKGKIAYMSPEQGLSQVLDRRSDLFSLSIMLWELTTFRRLFKADSDFESLRKIIQDEAPRPSRYRNDYPPELERIVMKGLQRKPADRYQSVEEMQLDLEAFAREHKLVISPVSLSRYVRELFQDRVDAWAQAKAEGKSFTEFLVETPTLKEGAPVTADTWIAPATEPTNVTRTTAEPLEISVSIEEPPSPASPKRRALYVMLALMILGAAGGAGWYVLQSTPTATATRPPVATTPPAPAAKPAIDPPAPTVTATQPAEGTPPETASLPPETASPPAAPPPTEPPAERPPIVTTKPTARAVAKPAIRPPAAKPAIKKPPPKKPNEDLDSPFPD